MEVIHYRAVEAPERSYTYKVGVKGALIGVALVIGSLAISKDFLGDSIEWRLFGPEDSFVVPTILIKLAWWGCFLMGAGVLVLSRLPAQSIMLERDGITVPNLWTRKYVKTLWSDVVRVNVGPYSMDIAARTRPTHIARLGVKKAEWEDLQRELAMRVPVSPAPGRPA